MKSYQNSFNEFQYYITPSDMIEFLYCKRFIYYMKCLGIKQYEDKRYKVEKGRELHRKKENENKIIFNYTIRFYLNEVDFYILKDYLNYFINDFVVNGKSAVLTIKERGGE